MANLTKSQIQTKINNKSILKKELLDYFKNKTTFKGLTKYRKDELIELFNLNKMTKKGLNIILRANNIKGRSKFNKKQAVEQVLKIRLQEIKDFKILQDKLRQTREIKTFRITQHSPINLSNYIPIIHKKNKNDVIIKNTFDDINNNKWIRLFNIKKDELIQKAIDEINKIKHTMIGYIGSKIQLQYIVDDNGATPRYTNLVDIIDNAKDINYSVTLDATDIRYVFIGYNIQMIHGDNKLNNKTIMNLKAFHPCNNIEYHKLSIASTSGSGLCIYETWRHILDIKSLKYSRRDNKEYREELYKALHNEGSEIEKSVKNGELVKSLQLLTEKYDTKTIVHFFGSHIFDENDKINIEGTKPIYINKGEIEEITDDIIKSFNGELGYLYEVDKHVAPFKFRIVKNDKDKKILKNIDDKKKSGFVLKPQNIKKDVKPEGILGFDCETFLDENHHSIPFNITLYGELKGKTIIKSFYGIDCIDEFFKYINEIATMMNDKITRPKNSIPPIFIYGFNNSNFDNIFIYKKFYDKDPNTEYVFTGNSIKYIKYNNVFVYDISLFYKVGDLRTTCKKFDLEEEKGVYPYNFPNKNNLNYIGDVPDLKYWNSNDEYNEYVKSNGKIFNMKEYTEKYCLLDSKLVYEMAKLHLSNSVGKINGKRYNAMKCPTSANLSVKMFSQCFLKDNLYQSPDNIIEKERKAYFGGRTEVFKKYFKSNSKNETLHYYDINSSYPASMLKIMPYKFLNSYTFDDKKININEITDHYLYKAKCEYKGNDKYYIPNLFKRLDNNNIISTKNKDYGYHWGCELKEAILSGCEITINEVNMYEGREVFKDFANYFYNERLKIKKTNKAKALFYKLVMNSLYGKTGQKVFNNSKICKYEEIPKHLNNDISKLVNIKEIDDKICLIEYKNDGDDNNSIGTLVRFASYITALSRTNLIGVMRDVGHKNIYYCDTDSVFTAKKPSDKFLDQNILGMWKEETETPIKEACFLAPKVYYYECFDGKQAKASKGLRSQDLTIDDMRKLHNGKVDKLENTRNMFYKSLNTVIIEETTRTLRPVYNKRKWNCNESEAFDNYEDYAKVNK